MEAGADDLAINRLKMDIRELETKLNEANDTGSHHNDAFTPLTLSVNYRFSLIYFFINKQTERLKKNKFIFNFYSHFHIFFMLFPR